MEEMKNNAPIEGKEVKAESVVAVKSEATTETAATETTTTTTTRHIEFTKILTASIVLMYVLNWAITWLVFAKTGNVSTDLKEYLDVPLNVIMAGYLTKSGVENVLIKK